MTTNLIQGENADESIIHEHDEPDTRDIFELHYPIHYVKRFLTEDFLELVANQSNLYAIQIIQIRL